MPKAISEDREFQIPQAIMQPGRIYAMIDVGTHAGQYQGQPTAPQRQIVYKFELPEDTLQDGRPLSIMKFVNLVIGDRATLVKIAKACGVIAERGFDPIELVGKACNVTITHYTTKTGKQGADAKEFAQLLKGQKVPELHNPIQIFDLDDFDQDVFDTLPKFLQEKITSSPEYQNKHKANHYGDSKYYQSPELSENPADGMDLEDTIDF